MNPVPTVYNIWGLLVVDGNLLTKGIVPETSEITPFHGTRLASVKTGRGVYGYGMWHHFGVFSLR